MKRKRTLPKGWEFIRLGDLADYFNGRAFKSAEWEKSGLPIIRIQNLNKTDAPFNYTTKTFEERYLVQNGELLFAWSASLGVYLWENNNAWLNQHIFKVVPKECVTKKFLFYSLKWVTAELYSKAHGSGMVHVTKKKFEATEIPLPPLPEQHRIVAKIEELFTQLDKGIEELQAVKRQLKTYRQAVLKHAFEGKFTEAWRKENPQPPANELLEQIKAERQLNYEQALEDWKKTVQEWEANGKEGKKPGKPRVPTEYPILSKEELQEYSKLPFEWTWVRIGSISPRITVGHVGSMKDQYIKNGIPFLRSQNVRINKFAPKGLMYISKQFHSQLKKSTLTPGDIVVVRSGVNVGNTCVIPHKLAEANCSDLVIIKKPIRTPSQFISYYINAVTKTRVNTGKVGVAIPHFNTRSVEEFIIPFPPIPEQELIIQEIENRLSICDKVEQTIEDSLRSSEALRQSILKKAFAGQLVEQDSSEELASELLKRAKDEAKKTIQKTLFD